MIERRRFPGVTKRQVTVIAAVVAVIVCTVERYIPAPPARAATPLQCK